MMKDVMIVTGVSQGIGYAIAQAFVNQYEVIGLDIGDDPYIEGLRFYQVDLGDTSELKRVFDDIHNEFARAHVLIAPLALVTARPRQAGAAEAAARGFVAARPLGAPKVAVTGWGGRKDGQGLGARGQGGRESAGERPGEDVWPRGLRTQREAVKARAEPWRGRRGSLSSPFVQARPELRSPSARASL